MSILAKNPETIVVVGGGFGGVATALDLARRSRRGQYEIILISDKPHFEYTPTLYRVVTGGSALEVCVPLAKIFAGTNVRLIEAKVTGIDLAHRTISCAGGYGTAFDRLVLALGSETAYFNIPGLAELSYGFKSTYEALILKKHLEGVMSVVATASAQEEKVALAHVAIVGAGASGTELAAELAIYLQDLARRHGIDAGLVTIDLFEGAPRVVPLVAPEISARIKSRLHALGVNVFLNRTLLKEEIDGVYLKDMQMKAKTVIWTAGVKPHHLLASVAGLSFDKRGKVIVNESLQVPGCEQVYVVGDGASTEFSGMAQTAIAGGQYVARKILGQAPGPFKPRQPVYAIPVGPGWAAVALGPVHLYGRLGWWLRRFADWRYLLSILSWADAWRAFRAGRRLATHCSICGPGEKC